MQSERSSRQRLFAPFGESGQAKLSLARALVVGVGATGSALAEGLVRAGIGSLSLVDRDLVELGNLGRQSLYGEADVGLPKAIVARERLAAIDGSIAIDAKLADAGPRLLERLAVGADLILDGTDNFRTRDLINELACRENIPWIYSGAIGALAVSMPVIPGETACLRCLYPRSPEREESCDTAGILHAAVLQAAALGLAEALKLLGGRSRDLRRELWTLDLWRGRLGRVSTAHPRPNCSVCVEGEYPLLDGEAEGLAVARICSNSVQVSRPEGSPPVDLAAIAGDLPDPALSPHALTWIEGELSLTLFADGRLVVEGSRDSSLAKALHRRLLP